MLQRLPASAITFSLLLWLCAAPAVSAGTQVTLQPSGSTSNDGDSFVSGLSGQTDKNYGAAGALEISGSSASKGEFKSLVRFDTSTAVSTFDGTYGSGNWSISTVVLKMTVASPTNNPLFNSNSTSGSNVHFLVDWLSSDGWTEGTGTPMAPTTTGITWDTLSNFTSSSQSVGDFVYNGQSPPTALSYTLTLASGLTDDLANDASHLTSFLLRADNTNYPGMSVLFNARNNGTASNRPALIITVSATNPVTTGAATNVAASSATIGGFVNANGDSTDVSFEYGTDTNYGFAAAATPSPVTGSTETAVTANITSLASNTTYHYRLKGVNSTTTLFGSDRTFTTPTAPEIVVAQPANTDLTDGVSSIGFGSQNVGSATAAKTFTIRNTGTATLNITSVGVSGGNPADFPVVTTGMATTLAPSASTTFSVTFTPSVAGSRGTTLQIVSNDSDESTFDVALTGTGVAAPEIAVEQPSGTDLTDGVSSIGYGTQAVGFATAAKSFTIRNTGTATLNLTLIGVLGGNAGDFTVDTSGTATTLAPSASTTFTVTFLPTAATARSTMLQIVSNDGDEGIFDVALIGTGVDLPEIVVEQPANTGLTDGVSSIGYGTQAVGFATAAKTFTIRNTGTATLNLTSIGVSGGNAGDFPLDTTVTASTLAPSASTTFTVTFLPTAAAARSTTLQIVSDDGDESTFDIALTGTGLDLSEIVVEQPANTGLTDGVSSLAFGTQAVGVVTEAKTFTIRNTGTATLNLTSVGVTGGNAADFLVNTTGMAATLAPSASTTFSVTFAPGAAGSRGTNLRIVNDDSDEGNFDIALTGTGVDLPEIAVEQPTNTGLTDGVSSIAFGNFQVGTSSPAKTFTIRNTGTDTLNVTSVAVTGGNTGDFTVSTTGMATSLAPSASTTFTVTFSPSAAGNRDTNLQIKSDDSDEATFDIALTGTSFELSEIAVEQPSGTDLTDQSSTVAYGSVALGSNSSKQFVIKNIGNADLTSISASIDGTNSPDFTITVTPSATVSGPSGTTTLTVQFAPAAAGARSAALHIASNDADENPFDIPLTGTGITPGSPTFTLNAAAYTVNEGPGASVPITVKRTGGEDTSMSVTLTTVGGTATAGTDYTTTTAPLTFAANGPNTQTVNVPVLNDALAEANETFTVKLQSNVGGALGTPNSAPVTIIDPTSQTFVGVGADAAPPSATISSPVNGSLAVNVTTGTTLNVTGTATDTKGVSKVQYMLNGAGGWVDAVLVTPGAPSTTWNAPIIPLTGTNTINVRAVDFAQGSGNVAVAGSKSTSPTVTLASATLPPGLVVNSDFMGRKITTISGVTVTLDGVANTDFGFISVTTSSTASTGVTLSSGTLPTGFGVGSTLLGRTVTVVAGTAVTLNGVANTTISVPTSVAYTAVINVLSSSLSTPNVTLSSATLPGTFGVGSTLLGRIVSAVAGTSVTLNGNASQAILAATNVAYTAAVPFSTTERVSATVVSTFKVLRNLDIKLAGSGSGTITPGFVVVPNGTNFREVGKSLTVTATPALPGTPAISNPGAVFTGWTVDNLPTLTQAQTLAQIGVAASSLSKPTMTFIFREGLVITAHFDKNQYPLLAGTYNGLIHASPSAPVVGPLPGPEDDITPRNVSTEGFFTALVDAKGGFSGKLTIDGSATALAFLGSFDELGLARFGTARTTTMKVTRTGKPSLTVEMHVSDTDGPAVAGGQQISGTVTATDFKRSVVTAVSDIRAERAFYGTAQVVTGKTVIGSPFVTTMATTTDRTLGELVTGSGIPAGTTILSVNSDSQITLDKNATTTVTANSLTFTRNVPAAYLGAASVDGTFTMVLPSRAPHYERDVTFDNTNSYVSVGAPNEFEDGDVVVFDFGSGTFPPELNPGDIYYVINKGAGTNPDDFQVTTVPGSFLQTVIITTPGSVATASLDPATRQTEGFERQDFPQGDGIGTVKLSKTGLLTVTATLADNTGVSVTAVTATSTLSSARTAPIFTQLYTLKGFLSTLVQFKELPLTNTDADILPAPGSEVLWLRPFQLDQYYPYGWPEVLKLDLQGAKYDATGVVLRKANNTPLLAADLINGNATLTFSDGKLDEDMPPKVVSISTAGTLNVMTKVPDPADPTYDMLTITAATGTITGRFLHTSDDVPNLTPFQAIIFQKGPHAGAYGFFRTRAPAVIDYTGESGGVSLIAN